MPLFIIYKTDVHHTRESRVIIAIATDQKRIIPLCKQQAKKEGTNLLPDDVYNLEHIKQTQNYKGEGEILIEEMAENVLV